MSQDSCQLLMCVPIRATLNEIIAILLMGAVAQEGARTPRELLVAHLEVGVRHKVIMVVVAKTCNEHLDIQKENGGQAVDGQLLPASDITRGTVAGHVALESLLPKAGSGGELTGEHFV